MGKKTEIDSYSKLFYWLDSMMAQPRPHKERQGLQRLRDFVEDKQKRGWKWEDIQEWAVYSTSQKGGFNPFEECGK